MMNELKRLHDLGLALHWLRPRSKMPIEKNWTTGARKPWPEFKRGQKPGANVGVRLGHASRFEDGTYLAIIDCDVKSNDRKHVKAMAEKLSELIATVGPTVASGRGNGSKHLYVRVETPKRGFRYSQSGEKVKVMMPGVPASNSDRKALSEADLKAGYRWRAAWEISVMGDGQQVVLPPSIHPDTGKAYAWAIPFHSVAALPLLTLPEGVGAGEDETPVGRDDGGFKPVAVDLVSSELPDSTVDLIMTGKNCSDDSAGLFTAAIAMRKARFSDDEILSVLTDPSTHLGKCPYRHASTKVRARAAAWVKRFTLTKAKAETSARTLFAEVVDVSDDEEKEAVEKLDAHALAHMQDDEWKEKLERKGGRPGASPKCTLKNIALVLMNAVSPKVVLKDTFANRSFYGLDTPWGGKQGVALTDIDMVLIKYWLATQFRFEPSTTLIFECVGTIAEWNAFHPVHQMLDALPPWDGVPRVAGWLKRHFEATGPDHYLDEVFFKFLAAMISRILKPGCQFDWMLIMEGEQGVGKSTFARLLAGEKYFTDWLPDLSDKDAAQALQGIWVVEMGELAALRKNETEAVKAFVTRRVDKYRPSYGRMTAEVPRQCVFMGSTNSSEYLRDDTGNRRFVPIQVGRCDFKAIKRDRDQLLAEVLWAYRNEMITTLELEGEAAPHALMLQKSRMVKDDSYVMAEQFSAWISENKMDGEIGQMMSKNRLKLLPLFGPMGPWHMWKADGRNVQLGGRGLRSLGYDSKKIRNNRFWYKIENE